MHTHIHCLTHGTPHTRPRASHTAHSAQPPHTVAQPITSYTPLGYTPLGFSVYTLPGYTPLGYTPLGYTPTTCSLASPRSTTLNVYIILGFTPQPAINSNPGATRPGCSHNRQPTRI